MKICKFVILLTFVLLVVEKVYPIQACPTLTLRRRVNVDKVLRSAAHQYLYMADRLKELGIPVVLTRDFDENISQEERLRRANEAFDGSPNAILISNHINAGGSDNPSGKLTFFEKKFNKFSKYDIIFTEKAVFNL